MIFEIDTKNFQLFSIKSILVQVFSREHLLAKRTFLNKNRLDTWNVPLKVTSHLSYSYSVVFNNVKNTTYTSIKKTLEINKHTAISYFGKIIIDSSNVNFKITNSIQLNPIQKEVVKSFLLTAKNPKIILLPEKDYSISSLTGFKLNFNIAGKQIINQTPYMDNSLIKIENPMVKKTIEFNIAEEDKDFLLIQLNIRYKESGDDKEIIPHQNASMVLQQGEVSKKLEISVKKSDNKLTIIYEGILIDKHNNQKIIDRTIHIGTTIPVTFKKPKFTVQINASVINWSKWHKVKLHLFTRNLNGDQLETTILSFTANSEKENFWSYIKEQSDQMWYYYIDYYPINGLDPKRSNAYKSQINNLIIPPIL